MTTVVFVHGTGIREQRYWQTFEYINQALHTRKPELKLMPCLWGDKFGARLHADGASIPTVDETRSIDDSPQTEQEDELAVWAQLYLNPLYELQLLALQPPAEGDFVPGQISEGEQFNERVQALAGSGKLLEKFRTAGLDSFFEPAFKTVTNSSAYQTALLTLNEDTNSFARALARAIVAQTLLECENSDCFVPALTDAALRDELVEFIATQLGEDTRSINSLITKKTFDLAVSMGLMTAIQRKRGVIQDTLSSTAGDILLYQARGESIRQYIREHIEQAEPPVVVLGHSLGGIASVDLLVKEPLPQVELLVTVGSQVPIMYEMNSLYSLAFAEPLPEHFPTWLNIYDQLDFLSYIGKRIFGDRIEDVMVDNRQPFARSHSAYWTNPQVWDAIVRKLP